MSRSNDLLAGLTAEQAAAAALTGPVLALAGAGTGKTKTLTAGVAHRIEVRGMPASRILAVTFTNKAAGEMTARIRKLLGDGAAPYWVGTFHGLGARQLRAEPEIAGLRPDFDIMDADDSRRVVKRVMKAMNLAAGDETVSIGRDPLKLMCNRLSAFKDDLVIPAEAAAYVEAKIADANNAGLAVDPHHLRAAAQVYVEYQRVLRDANAADFGDLLLWPVRAMRGNKEYHARWAGRFDAVLADEYQDVNRAQYSWVRLLASEHREIFAVGDDDQSIYGWRGAQIGYIRRFTRDFPGAAQVRLEENFRSTGHILAAANAVIARDHGRLGKTLYTRKPDGDRIEVVAFRNPEAEALGIVTEIQRRHGEGRCWEDMAILYRSNALSRGLEEALMRARTPTSLSATSASISAPRSRIRSPCCGWPQRRTARRLTRLSAGSSTCLRAGSVPRRSRLWRRKRPGVKSACCRPWRPPSCRRKPGPAASPLPTRSAVWAGTKRRPSPTRSRCCSRRPATAPCCARAGQRRPRTSWRTFRS